MPGLLAAVRRPGMHFFNDSAFYLSRIGALISHCTVTGKLN